MLAEMNQSFGGMDITVTPMMMAMAVPIALAVEFIKAIIGKWKIITPEIKKPLFPLLGIGLALMSFALAGIENWLLAGVLIGLSAGGGYDLFKGMARVGNGKAAATAIPPASLSMLLLLCAMLLTSGCMSQQNPRADLVASQKIFVATVDSLTVLIEADKFTSEEVNQIVLLASIGRDYLGQWEIEVKAGRDGPNIVQSFRVVLNKLIEYQLQKEGDML